MPEIAKRLSMFTESVIREMTRISNRYGAINLAQGFPDFDPPKALTDALKTKSDEGHHQYAVTWGAPSFRKALCEKQKHFMGLDLDPDENVVVTCGSTEAMMTAIMTAVNPGEKVIVFSPYYENYGADTILTGCEPIYVPLIPPDFRFDPDELKRAFEKGAKALILCNPGNPTGRVFTLAELTVIADLAKAYDAFIITDEVYEHIVYPPAKHVYMASLPDMFERTISVSSLSKTYSITGWRLGYVIAPSEIISGAKKVHDFLTVGAANVLQEAAVTALEFPLSYYDDFMESYLKKRDLFLGYLDRAGLVYTKPEGAYYVLCDISGFGFESDTDFAKWLAKEIGVAGVPGSSFFREPVNHLIRFHFAKKEETLIAAGERLMKLKNKG